MQETNLTMSIAEKERQNLIPTQLLKPCVHVEKVTLSKPLATLKISALGLLKQMLLLIVLERMVISVLHLYPTQIKIMLL